MNTDKRMTPTGSRERKFLNTPKGYVIATLVVLTAIAGLISEDYEGFINAGATIITAMVLDVLFGLLQKRKRLFPDGAVLTGLIVALVLSSATPWYISVSTTAIAIASKHLLKVRKKPVFNPAAFGLLVAIILFSSGQSWWGGFSMLPAWCIGFVLVGGFFVIRRVNKFPQVFAFLGSYFVLLLIMGIVNIGDAVDALRIPFINAALFLAIFMVTDPPTSPAKYKDQVLFGGITAVVSAIVYAMFGGLAYLLVGLLTANGWNAWRIYRNAT